MTLTQKQLTLCLIFILALAGFHVLAAESQSIALHPVHAKDQETADSFFNILRRELLAFPDASVYLINLADRSPDIPAVGFPAYICPSPSLTGDALYAITGEIVEDFHFPGTYRLLLFLWEMRHNRLVIFDQLSIQEDQEQTHYLSWLLSWIGMAKPGTTAEQMRVERLAMLNIEEAARGTFSPNMMEWNPDLWRYRGPRRFRGQTTPSNDPNNWIYTGPDGEKWLYFGIRGGGGSSQWYNNHYQDFGFPNKNITNFWAANVSLQASLHLFRHFAIQTEANLSADIGSLADITTGEVTSQGVFINWSLTVPLLLKLNFSGSHVKAGVFAGAYVYLPLWQMNNENLGDYFNYEPAIPGFTFGVSLGWKAGAGYIFIDGRVEYDGLWFSDVRDQFYYRNLIKFNIGYEVGFFRKRSR